MDGGIMFVVDSVRARIQRYHVAEGDLRPRAPNRDATLDIAEAIAVLNYLSSGQQAAGCLDAYDGNKSGVIDIPDAVHLLSYLLQAGLRRSHSRLKGRI